MVTIPPTRYNGFIPDPPSTFCWTLTIVSATTLLNPVIPSRCTRTSEDERLGLEGCKRCGLGLGWEANVVVARCESVVTDDSKDNDRHGESMLRYALDTDRHCDPYLYIHKKMMRTAHTYHGVEEIDLLLDFRVQGPGQPLEHGHTLANTGNLLVVGALLGLGVQVGSASGPGRGGSRTGAGPTHSLWGVEKPPATSTTSHLSHAASTIAHRMTYVYIYQEVWVLTNDYVATTSKSSGGTPSLTRSRTESGAITMRALTQVTKSDTTSISLVLPGAFPILPTSHISALRLPLPCFAQHYLSHPHHPPSRATFPLPAPQSQIIGPALATKNLHSSIWATYAHASGQGRGRRRSTPRAPPPVETPNLPLLPPSRPPPPPIAPPYCLIPTLSWAPRTPPSRTRPCPMTRTRAPCR